MNSCWYVTCSPLSTFQLSRLSPSIVSICLGDKIKISVCILITKRFVSRIPNINNFCSCCVWSQKVEHWFEAIRLAYVCVVLLSSKHMYSLSVSVLCLAVCIQSNVLQYSCWQPFVAFSCSAAYNVHAMYVRRRVTHGVVNGDLLSYSTGLQIKKR